MNVREPNGIHRVAALTGTGSPDSATVLAGLIHELRPDAEELVSLTEVQQATGILQRGTSAHRQRRVRQTATDNGASPEDAMRGVVDFLIEETCGGL